MKKIILMTLVCLGFCFALNGCERNDYQHPLHRSTNK